jgi:hypothetical protein
MTGLLGSKSDMSDIFAGSLNVTPAAIAWARPKAHRQTINRLDKSNLLVRFIFASFDWVMRDIDIRTAINH